MLETAASDLYTQCGLRRLISLSKIDEFIVPHLPNKYYLRMGIPIEDLRTQIAMLQKLHRNGGWRGELFEPGSAARCFRWSKDLYERPDEQLLKAIPPMAENVLSVGCGWGENEKFLSRKNLSVCAVPVDAVFGALLSKRGIRNVVGPLPEVLEELGGEQFDAVLLADVLHLVSDPVDWLRRLSVCLKPDGVVVASVPNTGELSRPIQKWLDSASNRLSVRGSNTAVHRISVSIVRSWLGTAGLTAVSVRPSMDGAERRLRRWASKVLGAPAAKRFIITAKPTK
jgi:SAM-dependent methyltransferase